MGGWGEGGVGGGGGGGEGGGGGVGVVGGEGVRVWIESWSKCALPTCPVWNDSTAALVHSAPVELHGEITDILAGMALSYRSREANT